jgi:hypothetical protein
MMAESENWRIEMPDEENKPSNEPDSSPEQDSGGSDRPPATPTPSKGKLITAGREDSGDTLDIILEDDDLADNLQE